MSNFDPKSIRNGKAWCDVVNTEPLPVTPRRTALAIGSCNADRSNFKPYDTPVEVESPFLSPNPTGSYIWLGDFRL